MSVLGFELEWLNEVSGIIQIIYMKYFLDDQTVELLTEKSCFLKRIYYPQINLSDMFIGNSVTIFNRLMIVKKFANKATIEFMNAREIRYLCKVTKEDLIQFGKLLIIAKKCGLVMGKVATISSNFYSSIIEASVGDVIMELVGILASNKDAFMNYIQTDKQLCCVTAIKASADEILEAFKYYSKPKMRTSNCTLCLIKPHIMKSQLAGELLTAITNEGYKIGSMFSVHLTLTMAEELFEVYRGVLLNYTAILEHMCTTPVLAIMIINDSDIITNSNQTDIVDSFREFTGPQNPALAKVIRPNSIRAKFGIDSVQNAIHCTDLSTDGEMECRYFFETLASL